MNCDFRSANSVFKSPIHIVEAVKVNNSRKRAIGREMLRTLGDALKSKTVALLDITFKPQPRRHARCALDRVGVARRGRDDAGL